MAASDPTAAPLPDATAPDEHGESEIWSESESRALFRELATESTEYLELALPLPKGTVKKEIQVHILEKRLTVRHDRFSKPILHARPLAHAIDADESMWYFEGNVLIVDLAKLARGGVTTASDWGDRLEADGACVTCYLSASEVLQAWEGHRESRQRARTDAAARKHTAPDPWRSMPAPWHKTTVVCGTGAAAWRGAWATVHVAGRSNLRDVVPVPYDESRHPNAFNTFPFEDSTERGTPLYITPIQP
jgi:hypothetical protein